MNECLSFCCFKKLYKSFLNDFLKILQKIVWVMSKDFSSVFQDSMGHCCILVFKLNFAKFFTYFLFVIYLKRKHLVFLFMSPQNRNSNLSSKNTIFIFANRMWMFSYAFFFFFVFANYRKLQSILSQLILNILFLWFTNKLPWCVNFKHAELDGCFCNRVVGWEYLWLQELFKSK